MIKFMFAWLFMFAISALLARGQAWRFAFQKTMFLPSFDEEAIYERIKGRVFNRSWGLSAFAASTLFAAAMFADYALMLLLIGAAVVLIVAVTSVQAAKLFRTALLEMNLPWPPPKAER